MSQSLKGPPPKVPRGVAIRAVAAAQLYASRLDGQITDDRKAEEELAAAAKADLEKAGAARKPVPRD